MKIRIKYLILYITIALCSKTYGQYITTDEGFSAQHLVENVLINSTCASTSNWAVSGGDFGTTENSFAYFDASGTTFPFQNGIVLSTGKAINTQGPNSFLSDDGVGIGWNGDADLQNALGLNNSYNATVLEFDFVPQGNKISFDYIFSSEQYLQNPSSNQCNFTDGFAFLLKEVGTSEYINLALIPNTTIPVKVNTVRGSGTICPPANEEYFDAFNNLEHPTNFNGQTKVMTAKADVIPGLTYHIKLVIADEGNARFDSAIFLGGGSFNFDIDLGIDRLLATGNPLCENEIVTINATQTNGSNYQWFKNDEPIAGATNPILNVAEEGIYKVTLLLNGSCQTKGTIRIEKAPILQINQNEFNFCDDDNAKDGKTSINLENIKSSLFSNLPSSYSISFFETQSSTTALPNNFTNTIAFDQTIYAKITNIQNCYTAFPVQLKVNVLSLGEDEIVGICNGNSANLIVPNGYSSYSWNTNPVQNASFVSVSLAGIYTVTVTDENGCTDSKSFVVESSEPATIEQIQIQDFNSNNSVKIIVSGNGIYEYAINGGAFQSNNYFSNLSAGNYNLMIRDMKGCEDTFGTFQILEAPHFFSPNNDGINDVWQIPYLSRQSKTKISIFDRYGKLVYNFKSNQAGWNGTFNGSPLPATDYWYKIEFENGRIVKGHFSLIR